MPGYFRDSFYLGLLVPWLLIPPAAADELPAEVTIATWNLEWFFDDQQADNHSPLSRAQSAPSKEEWHWKRDRVAEVIAEVKPTILALQEVENRRVLRELTQQLKSQYQLHYRIAFVEGWDTYTEQDVAILYQSGLVQYSRHEQSRDMYESKEFYNVSKHLVAHFRWQTGDQTEELTLVNVHFRASEKGASLRQRQAKLIRYWIDPHLQRGSNVIVLGDLNSEENCQQPDTDCEVGLLCGRSQQTVPQLTDLHRHLLPARRATHMIGKQFDRILVSPSLQHDDDQKRDLVFDSIRSGKDLVVRGEKADTEHRDIYYKIPQQERDVSDHYPLIARFKTK
jgi:endonuclease/exonuclease/phosphatase family metal-dependent hydrolase